MTGHGELRPRMAGRLAKGSPDLLLKRSPVPGDIRRRIHPLAWTALLCLVSLCWPGDLPAGNGVSFGGSIHKERLTRPLALQKDRNGTTYHNGETLICSDCHTVHYSQAHGYENDGSGEYTPLGPSGPYEKILRNEPLDLCLSCHDNHAGIPDVYNADVNGLAERSGGFFSVIDDFSPRGHDLGRDLEVGGPALCLRCHWSQPEDARVTCIDCHNPHGNGNARNLQWASDPDGTPPLGLFTPDGMTGLGRYERANVAYGTLNSLDLREATSICIDCHHVFSGPDYTDPDGDNIHSRHPSFDSERGDPNSVDQGLARGTTDPVHWEGGTGSGFDGTSRVPFVVSGASDYASATVVDASTNGSFCLSCHKAHGSENAFGIVWELDGAIERKGCDQCHAMKPLP